MIQWYYWLPLELSSYEILPTNLPLHLNWCPTCNDAWCHETPMSCCFMTPSWFLSQTIPLVYLITLSPVLISALNEATTGERSWNLLWPVKDMRGNHRYKADLGQTLLLCSDDRGPANILVMERSSYCLCRVESLLVSLKGSQGLQTLTLEKMDLHL